MANPIVTFEMENGSVIRAELYPDIAPNTVNNFISLVKKGFYDGVIFHRVISGFMLQGVLSMARTMAPNSAGSQFFIMHEDAPHLDGQYAAFGRVTEGLDVVDAIAAVRTDYNDRPRIPQVMKKVTVDTFGVEYPEPEKV